MFLTTERGCLAVRADIALLMLFPVRATTNDGRDTEGSLGELIGFLVVNCKTETTVMDTAGLAPTLKLVRS